MGQSWSRDRSSNPSPGQDETDLEAYPHKQPVPAQGSTQVNGFPGLRERYGSVSEAMFLEMQKTEKDEYAKVVTSKLDSEFDDLCAKYPRKIYEYKDAIQPHTDEGGEAYFIGDAYQDINPVFADEWALPDPKSPYLRYVKHLAKTWKHLEYLGHWMEVTCAPPKWKFLRRKECTGRREERARMANVHVIDYTNGSVATSKRYDDCVTLKEALKNNEQTSEARQARLIIAEDLSRDLVETLGAEYDIDPLFFASHIGDYLFHNTRDRWVELPSLDVDARKMSHFCLSYLRARYFENEEDFNKAEYQTGMFNVLRRLDSDRSRRRLQNSLLDLPGASVALSRAKTSLWVGPRNDGDPITVILLVDPTPKTGHSHPLWGGYRPFQNTPSMADWSKHGDSAFAAPGHKSLFEDVVYWSEQLSSDDLKLVGQDPRCLALAMFKLVIADWLTVLKYMTTMLGKMEWEFEKPHWGGDPKQIDELLRKLSPWRRNVGYYETMISEAIARLFPPEIRAPLHASATNGSTNMDTSGTYWSNLGANDKGVRSLWTDFQNVKRQMDEIQARIKTIEQTATNAINIEESRRAVDENIRSVKQNKNLARLTFLATIFIPLNFTSSFLSISPDFPKAHTTVWLFFVIGIPLTILALVVVDLTHPDDNGHLKKFLRDLRGKPRKKGTALDKNTGQSTPSTTATTSGAATRPPLRSQATIPWTRRNPTTYAKGE